MLPYGKDSKKTGQTHCPPRFSVCRLLIICPSHVPHAHAVDIAARCARWRQIGELDREVPAHVNGFMMCVGGCLFQVFGYLERVYYRAVLFDVNTER